MDALDRPERTPTLDRDPWRIGRDALPPITRPDATLSVLDITEWYGATSGGIRTYLLQKAAYVAAKPSLRHVLSVPGSRDVITEADGVRMYRLRGPRIPGQAPYRFMLATRSIRRIVQHERPDVIEIGSPFLVPWIVRHATRRLDVPLVCFYHTNLPRMFSPHGARGGTTQRAVYRASWQYMRRLDRMFPVTVVTSQFSNDDLAREGITRTVRIPLGVDVDCFTPANRVHRDATRRQHGLPEGPLAAFVGRFAAEKDLEVVLDAWGDVERRSGARLALVGAGPMEARLRRHPYASRVTFLPFVTDRQALSHILASIDVYVAPGSIETFGLSSLESLSSGTPVLSADQGGVCEQVTRSGSGRLFTSHDRESLAAEAVALFADDLPALGLRARRYVEREHTWEMVFDRLFAVYRDILAR
jgi:alpha-1,6-mannosyltransferase